MIMQFIQSILELVGTDDTDKLYVINCKFVDDYCDSAIFVLLMSQLHLDMDEAYP